MFAGCAWQACPRGGGPGSAAEQCPSIPARLQTRHIEPSPPTPYRQGTLQQKPSVQYPDPHSASLVQAVPSSFQQVPSLLTYAHVEPVGHVALAQQTPLTQLPEPQVVGLQADEPIGLRHVPALPGNAQVQPVLQLADAQQTESTQCPDAHSEPVEHAVPSGAVPARAAAAEVSTASAAHARATQRTLQLTRRVVPIALMAVPASPCRQARPARSPGAPVLYIGNTPGETEPTLSAWDGG